MLEKPMVICGVSRRSLKSFLVTIHDLGGGRAFTPVVLATLAAEDLPHIFYYS